MDVYKKYTPDYLAIFVEHQCFDGAGYVVVYHITGLGFNVHRYSTPHPVRCYQSFSSGTLYQPTYKERTSYPNMIS